MTYAALLQDSWNALAQFGDGLARIWPLFIAIGAMFGGLKYAWRRVRKELEEVIDAKTEPMRAEMQPNGGGSLKDAVNRTEAGVHEIRANQAQTTKLANDIVGEVQSLRTDMRLEVARQKALIAASSGGYYEIDENAKLTYINDAYLTITGLGYLDAMADGWKNVIDPRDLDHITRSTAFALQNKVEWSDRFRIRRPTDGKHLLIQAKAVPMIDGTTFKGFAGVITVTRELDENETNETVS